MTLIRSLLFGVFFYGGTVVSGILYLPLIFLPGRIGEPFFNFWVRCAMWMTRALAGIRTEFRFQEEDTFPDRPVIYASKHQSAWETLAFKHLLPRPAFVLKKELLNVPFFGWYLAKTRQIAVDRNAGAKAMRAMVRQAEEAVAEGYSIVIYPQGTRVAPGVDMPYHPGVFALYKALDIPVVPIALNSGRLWARNGLIKRAGTVTVSVLPSIEPGLGRKEFMEKLESAIESETLRLE